MNDGAWNVVMASARGSSHAARGLPNQDSVAARALGDGAYVAAVADGHGGERYVRSERGSRLATAVALDESQRWWRTLSSGMGLTLDRGRDLIETIVMRWRDEVGRDVAAKPLSGAERERLGPAGTDVTIAYGTTLLFAVGEPNRVLVAQLGDGDAVVVTSSGEVLQPVPLDDRLVGGQTTSLCLPDATADCRFATLARDDIHMLILSTDGYGNSFADADWRDRVGRDLRHLVTTKGIDSVGESLPGWLQESADAAGDDATLVILSCARQSC